MTKNCLHCGATYTPLPTNRKKSKYCGRECYRLHYFSLDRAKVRFWERVKKSPGCWIWQGCLNTKGYGTLMLNRRQEIAHRVAWVFSGMVLPTGGKFLCHTCDEPKCVNPSHMFIGDHKDNAVDKARKGRCRNSTLTIEQVRQVKRELASKRKNTEIAAMFGVSPAVISGIKTGKNFWHVEPDQRK